MHIHPISIAGILIPELTKKSPIDSEAFEIDCWLVLAAAAQLTLRNSWANLIQLLQLQLRPAADWKAVSQGLSG